MGLNRVSFGQLIIVLLLGILLFSDISVLRQKLEPYIRYIYKFFNNRKKGT